MKPKIFFRRYIIFGSLISTIGAWIAYAIFLFIDQNYILDRRDISFDVRYFTMNFFAGNVILLLPVLFGGAILMFTLQQDFINKKFSAKKSCLKGTALGFIIGLSVSLFVWLIAMLISYSHGGPTFLLFLYRTIIATIIASIAGGLLGGFFFLLLQHRFRTSGLSGNVN
jgi:hypothetical protein